MSAGLIRQDQLEECVSIARAEAKPLGHVLVERGIVHAHSIAMALADQHGGPLKTEFGFATGSGSGRSAPAAGQPPSNHLSQLRLAPMGEPPLVPLSPQPFAPSPVAKAPTSPVVPGLTAPAPAPPALPPTAVAPEATTARGTATSVVLNVEFEAATAARAAAERRANELQARVEELEAASARAAEDASGPLLAQIDELRVRLEAHSATEETLNETRELLAHARATEESLRSQLATERAGIAEATTAAETLRAELGQLRARNQAEAAAVASAAGQLADVRDQLAATAAEAQALRAEVDTLRANDEAESSALAGAEHQLAEVRDDLSKALAEGTSITKQLDELRARHAADFAAASAARLVAEQAAAALRGELAAALADAETLRSGGASESAARAEAEAIATDLRNQLDDLQAQLAESVARVSAEEQHETTRRELDDALLQVETSRRQIEAEHATTVEVAAMADELGARVATLEAELRRARLSVVPPVNAEVDRLRAVIELQEQALEAASARERARDGSRNPRADDGETTASYADDAHVLFALGAGGYELFERSGPAPPIGSIVELSGGRTCRVMRIGPSPFPGGLEACAYLDIA